MKEIISMSIKELDKLEIINQLAQKSDASAASC